MAKFSIRKINLGRVESVGTAEASDGMTVWQEAHPEIMDPIIQCERGVPVSWIEITPWR